MPGEMQFSFSIPEDHVLATARKMAESKNPDEQDVGFNVLRLTDISERTRGAVSALNDPSKPGNFDIAVYVDYKFGKSLDAAKRLNSSSEQGVRDVARVLLAQFDSVVKSKAAVVGIMMRSK